ncbi:MAG: ATP-dependent helicase HrpB [Hyphomicrobiales bacterium]|nr:MAG: ATP-dependent helicase HrpB [Hyphomicrobiales bacterium]
MSLPIEAVKAQLLQSFRDNANCVLVAEPGAGKTTQVPQWLLLEKAMAGQKIILLEPRRVAARAAAEYMAKTLGEKVGDTVGLRMRADTRIGPNTRLEVVTEGVFTRMILDQPELPGIGAVLFDEFHERSLDADLGLALALDVQSALRDDLKLMVLSATIDASAVSALMGDAPVISSKGRAYPVETFYVPGKPRISIVAQTVSAVKAAMEAHSGSVLVFLPGRSEIERTRKALNDFFALNKNIVVAPLYSGLPFKTQRSALEPAPKGMRKIALSTNLAQTSMTIEGVRIVIDSGLTRQPRYIPQIGATSLETRKESQAAADQRRGRAGRVEPGVCYRLWAEPETRSMPAYDRPELLETDLLGFVLDIADWGLTDPADLNLLDQPLSGNLLAAKAELLQIGALDEGGRITELGKRLHKLPVEPHLGAMILSVGNDHKKMRSAALLAALIMDSSQNREIDLRVSFAAAAIRNPPQGFANLCRRLNIKPDGPKISHDELGALLLKAFPNWIAQNKAQGQFQLASGQRINCPDDHDFAKQKYLIVGGLFGTAANLRMTVALPLSQDEYLSHIDAYAVTSEVMDFDRSAGRVVAKRVRKLGAIVLESAAIEPKDQQAAQDLFWQSIASTKFETALFPDATKALMARLQFLHTNLGDEWPDSNPVDLLADVENWLRPYFPGVTSLKGLNQSMVIEALKARMPNIHQLEQLAPKNYILPSGRPLKIDYSGASGPVISARVHEFYGLTTHPTIARNVALVLNLLSPAQRSIQITQNLPAFWQGSWADVRADMRGRYPKHKWPEKPGDIGKAQ